MTRHPPDDTTGREVMYADANRNCTASASRAVKTYLYKIDNSFSINVWFLSKIMLEFQT